MCGHCHKLSSVIVCDTNVLCVVIKLLKPELRGLYWKVAMYQSCEPGKFYDDIRRDPRPSVISFYYEEVFDFAALYVGNGSR